MKIIYFVVAVSIVCSCGNHPAPTAPKIPATVPTETDTLTKYYDIEKTDGNGYYLSVYVYITDVAKIPDVNIGIIKQSAGKWKQTLDIWYFDKKGIVDKYIKMVDNKNVSDAEFDKIDKHMVCQFEKTPEESGSFDYNR